MAYPLPGKVTVEQRDRLIRQLRDLLGNRPEILLALLHGSFLAGGLFRDVDRRERRSATY
ncbi:MAG: hypothetical protein P0119_20170 [Nitrospira sp.]|nr:hypothetical protein [Nitrospira sp.]